MVAIILFLRGFRPPTKATVGLDPSWALGIAEASVHHFVFGRDILFTYGPLGFLTYGAGPPQTYYAIAAVSILVALGVTTIVIVRLNEEGTWLAKSLSAFAFIVVVASARHAQQLIFLCIIVGLTLVKVRAMNTSPSAALVVGVLAGLAGLTKFTDAVAAGVGGGVLLVAKSAIDLLRNPKSREWTALIAFPLGLVASSSVMFAASDYGMFVAILLCVGVTSIVALPAERLTRSRVFLPIALGLGLAAGLAPSYRAFVGGAIQLVSGYSSALSLVGPGWQLYVALGVLAIVALILIGNARTLGLPACFALAFIAFVAFKEGYVRQDGHVLFTFWCALAIAAAVLPTSRSLVTLAANGLAVALLAIAFNAVRVSFGFTSPIALALDPRAFGAAIQTFVSVVQPAQQIADDFEAGLDADKVPNDVRAALAQGSVDVWPWEANVAFANDLDWRPEPVFQTYAAYTPTLDNLNARYVRDRGADRILFSWLAIDGRYPLWDQPAAFRELLCNYRLDPSLPKPVRTKGGESYLGFARIKPHCRPLSMGPQETASWGVPIALPSGAGLQFVRFQPHYSALGLLLRLLYRVPDVNVVVVDQHRIVRRYRVISATSEDGILINPLPSNLGEFQTLLSGQSLPAISAIMFETTAPFYFTEKFDIQLEADY
jgi:hypothetical protein